MMHRTHELSTEEGQRVVLHEWKICSPHSTPSSEAIDVVLILHSNGFQSMAHEPMIERLLSGESTSTAAPLHYFGLDLRGHGESTPVLDLKKDLRYDVWSDDALRAVEYIHSRFQGQPHRLHGFGHSLGGTVLLLSEIRGPGSFASIFVFEPNVVTPTFQAVLQARGARPGRLEVDDDSPLVKATLGRRDGFTTFEEALAYHRGRSPFKHLDPACLEAYLRTGLERREDGRWWLRCSPAVEAEVFRSVPSQLQHRTFDRLTELRLPVTVASGRQNESAHGVIARGALECGKKIPGARTVEFNTLMHMGPLEDPALVGEAILDHLQWVRNRAQNSHAMEIRSRL